jgi:hypothetical protein
VIGNGFGVRLDNEFSTVPTTIGGATAGAGNLISGNGGGISLGGSLAGTLIQGNLIGTDVTGTVDLGNLGEGIFITFGSCCHTIGGTTPAARNVISGNGTEGIRSQYHTNVIQGNLIGTQIDGSGPLGNGSHGIWVNFSAGHTVGGSDPGARNTIAFNGGDGLFVSGGPVRISSNSIFSNSGLGIDLDPDGVTTNDPGDGDTGSNGLQNHPVLTSATTLGTTTTIGGTLGSKPSATFTVELFSSSTCDASGRGEGRTALGSLTVVTDGSGNASFVTTLPVPVLPGNVAAATAIDGSGNTSEFGACFTVACSPALPSGTIDLAVERGRIAWTPSTSTASTYDLVRGSLGVLRTSGGDFTQATEECLANDLAPTELSYGIDPPSGQGSWFLVRGVNCAGNGTYDSGTASQVGLRDAEIAASPDACP